MRAFDRSPDCPLDRPLERIYLLFDPGGLGRRLARRLGLAQGQVQFRRFPDGESYVRILDECRGCHVALFAQLDRPDEKLPALLFAAAQLHEMGAATVGLIAPYLPYMRHDQRFNSGEALSSRRVSEWLQSQFQWLVTVDPHLHRYHDLSELYRIPALAVSAAPALAQWLRQAVEWPLLIGPDAESEQWVRPVAEALGAPWYCLHKERSGDREVSVSLCPTEEAPTADWNSLGHYTPVLVDDILSTGMTLQQAAAQLRAMGLPRPLCLVVHALFADHGDSAQAATLNGTVARVVSTDSVLHPSNAIAVDALLAQALSGLCRPA